ncbi:MAG: hypothetical protein HQL28_07365, partial [Candidatus Omnitrophica bacterium]|nr:hypothetical protein [Candidatus Omnitrophota bacterium]
DANIGEDAGRRLKIIHEEAKRCSGIVQGLLGFAMPKPFEKKRVDANEVIETTLKIAGYAIGKDNIKIIRNFAKDGLFIIGDPARLEQVFMNIIMNALNAMPDGGTLTVTTRKEEEGNGTKAVVSFKDTGIGMTEETKKKIFEPFFTTSYDEGRKGLGLGLSISYSIIKAHSAGIVVGSEGLGKGSEFKIIFPGA